MQKGGKERLEGAEGRKGENVGKEEAEGRDGEAGRRILPETGVQKDIAGC